MTGASAPQTGLGSAEAPEPCGLGPSGAIPSAELDRIEFLLARATPLPWPRVALAHVITKYIVRSDGGTLKHIAYRPEDDLLIAAAMNVLPRLIALARGQQVQS